MTSEVYSIVILHKDAFYIGKAFSQFVEADEIIVGHDGRLSNIEMYSAIAGS